MKCPMTAKWVSTNSNGLKTIMGDCIKEECAGYHPTTLSCELSRIASNLSTLNNYMALLVDKMPHAEQFTK